MNEEEKKVIDYLIFHKYENSSKKEDMIDKVIEIIEKQQKELEKKDKIIDKMADILIGLPLNEKLLSFGYKEEVKGYFTNLVEKENK